MATLKAVLLSALLAPLGTFGLPSSSSPSPEQRRSVVHERRSPDRPSPWSKRERIPRDEAFEVRIGLVQQSNIHQHGHDLLMEVSDPWSPKYGQHWTPEEVMGAFSPSDETVRAAVDWVTSTLGIGRERLTLGAGGGWLSFTAGVEEAEALLQTEYWLYEHQDGDEEGQLLAAGADHYSVPEDLAEHIDFVFPGVVLGELKTRRSGLGGTGSKTRKNKRSSTASVQQRRQTGSGNATTCAELLTPACIKALYGLPAADKAHANNSLGLFEQSSWYQFEDLDLFFATHAPDIPQGTRPLNLSVNQAAWFYNDTGDVYATFPDEADLDVEVAWPIVYPQSVTVFQVDDVYYNLYSASTLGLFNTFLDAIDGAYCNYSAYGETGDNAQYDPVYPDNNQVTAPGGGTYDPGTYKLPRMCGVYKPTNVISISYSRVETTFTAAYQKRQCDEFLKLGLMGVSIVVASGDAGPIASSACHSSDLGSFAVQSPVNCPYVTSVGATQLLADGSETAVQGGGEWASGGGFSDVFAQPSYQADAVATFLADHPPAAAVQAKFNASGRGIPDLSAAGANIAIAVDGALSGDGEGTSAAAPLVAAMLNLVNEERLAAGKGTVGFVNPVLYANASAIFRDVTAGNSDMCDGLVTGFEAAPGWDPVTGLGTPQWAGLKEVFLSLP